MTHNTIRALYKKYKKMQHESNMLNNFQLIDEILEPVSDITNSVWCVKKVPENFIRAIKESTIYHFECNSNHELYDEQEIVIIHELTTTNGKSFFQSTINRIVFPLTENNISSLKTHKNNIVKKMYWIMKNKLAHQKFDASLLKTGVSYVFIIAESKLVDANKILELLQFDQIYENLDKEEKMDWESKSLDCSFADSTFDLEFFDGTKFISDNTKFSIYCSDKYTDKEKNLEIDRINHHCYKLLYSKYIGIKYAWISDMDLDRDWTFWIVKSESKYMYVQCTIEEGYDIFSLKSRVYKSFEKLWNELCHARQKVFLKNNLPQVELSPNFKLKTYNFKLKNSKHSDPDEDTQITITLPKYNKILYG